ncbi:PfkB family carbohydrate kinase [Phenylobacterium sp. LH3H17]|uniref:PfkB family carbohydrate kinase n=1 Tax=Phenylobacterium sp. LH3H17 TaxID=2903901 RepID=UPI0020C9978C|nr:PfkB family carbohydrate kinase [Phenylobacterium sp. LH3H17]UTP39799.1 PfkB family carbohydrate kinase [Phenylobacterium sp. LH3H17]
MSDPKPQAFGTGLIALDLVMSADPEAPVRSWAGGTCGNVLSILAYLGWDAYPIGRMNGDPASQRVKADMKQWGVRLDFAGCAPTSHTPIIIQEIRRGRDGAPTHRFSWACPRCGQWLPSFKAVTRHAVEAVAPKLAGSAVFFMDRLSRASLTLAAQASADGAVVVFEPSGKSDPKLFAEALRLAHVVKYADQRLAAVGGVMAEDSATLVEVQTLGAAGLKFRHRLGRGISAWKHLDAVPAPRVADTCGSGDWCTAGLVAKVAASGQKGLRAAGVEGIQSALRYGQALAAWNCGFEGARGGMYAIDRSALDAQIEALLSGRLETVPLEPRQKMRSTSIACPACPPDKPKERLSSAKIDTPARRKTSAA